MRHCKAIITATRGRGVTKTFDVMNVENYTTEQSIDNDADSFSVDIGDPYNQLGMCLERDTEVKVELYLDDIQRGVLHLIFTGLADTIQKEEDGILSITGRDVPGAIATDSDALPGRFPHIAPKSFIVGRATKLGIAADAIKIPKLSPMKNLYTDGSETEWSFWYRIARAKGMYMWSNAAGELIIDHLAYKASPDYHFGASVRPGPRNWTPVTKYRLNSNKQTRVRRVVMYGTRTSATAKGPIGMVQQSVDVHIRNWQRKPVIVDQNAAAKTPVELKTEAGDDMFESIVGAQEHTVQVRDTGSIIQQNKMARLTLPDEGIDDVFFVVGVQRAGGPDGAIQTIRLREKNFALSKRVPDAPTLTGKDATKNKSVAGIDEALGNLGIRWEDSFRLATLETGVPAGWDFATFLGALLSICQQESHFKNIREPWGGPEWTSRPGANANIVVGATATTPEGASVVPHQTTAAQEVAKWQKKFANESGNPLNPYYPNRDAGVGPMQLTTASVGGVDAKVVADEMGWSGKPKHGEYDGGRWNPDSNIRTAAKVLVEKGQQSPAVDPTDPAQIWIAVARYHSSGQSGLNYANEVKAIYNTDWAKQIPKALAPVQALAPGSTETDIELPDGSKLSLPDNAPAEVRKAINFALRHLGEPYVYGGDGTIQHGTAAYDCSSLVTAALASASANLRNKLNEPRPGNHGDTTYTLVENGRFPKIAKDKLFPGDMIFFTGEHGEPTEHMGMYLGDGWFIHDPHTGDVVKISALGGDYYRDHFEQARRAIDWAASGASGSTTAGTSGAKKKIMIQAGHTIPSGQSDEPYGHTGETGASGEQDFTAEIRDKAIALFSSDPRFDATAGTAWDASAGVGSSTSDDVDYDGDLFLSVHYSIGTSGSGYFFGYTRGATDSRPDALSVGSAKLADKIGARIDAIPGAPTRTTDNVGFGGSPANSTGWGYYAWGSALRSSPNDVDHVPKASAAAIIECGLADDVPYLTHKRMEIARAIYQGICDYYGVNPLS